MKKRVFGRGSVVLLAAGVVSAVVAAIALGVGPPSGTPPTLSGTPAGQLSLNGGTPFSVSSFQWGAGVGVTNSNPPSSRPRA